MPDIKEKKEIAVPKELLEVAETDKLAPEGAEKAELDTEKLVDVYFETHTSPDTLFKTSQGDTGFYGREDLIRRPELNGKSLRQVTDELGLFLTPIVDKGVFEKLSGGRDDFYYVEGEQGWYILTKNRETYELCRGNTHEEEKQTELKEKIEASAEKKPAAVGQEQVAEKESEPQVNAPQTYTIGHMTESLERFIKSPRKIESPYKIEEVWSRLREELHKQR